MSSAAAIVLAAFALGSIPFGFLIYRLRSGGDIRRVGSGNIGATNVLRSSGKVWGLLTLLLDAGKGWLAVWMALHFAPARPGVIAMVLIAVVLGHIHSPWLRFRGGKGVATGLGAFLALDPAAMLAALVVFALVLAVWRYVSLASICACLALPAILAARHVYWVFDAAALAAAVLIISRHHANIDRLRRGTEHRLGAKA